MQLISSKGRKWGTTINITDWLEGDKSHLFEPHSKCTFYRLPNGGYQVIDPQGEVVDSGVILVKKFALEVIHPSYGSLATLVLSTNFGEVTQEFARHLRAKEWVGSTGKIPCKFQETGPDFDHNRHKNDGIELIRQHGGGEFIDLVFLDTFYDGYCYVKLFNNPSHISEMWVKL